MEENEDRLGGVVFIIMVMMMSGMVVRANVDVNRQETC